MIRNWKECLCCLSLFLSDVFLSLEIRIKTENPTSPQRHRFSWLLDLFHCSTLKALFKNICFFPSIFTDKPSAKDVLYDSSSEAAGTFLWTWHWIIHCHQFLQSAICCTVPHEPLLSNPQIHFPSYNRQMAAGGTFNYLFQILHIITGQCEMCVTGHWGAIYVYIALHK